MRNDAGKLDDQAMAYFYRDSWLDFDRFWVEIEIGRARDS